jgi:tRNA G18 (ribose-2'-O)-methylase SpoU
MPLIPPLEVAPDTVREALRPLRNDFSVAVLRAGNAFAVGAIIRVAHSFLAREILLVGSQPYYAKASMGMHKYETIVPLADEDALFEHAHDRPVFAIEKDGARRSLYEVRDFPKNVVLVFGSEREGIPRSVLDRADDVLGIPMYGVNHSFPVTVAAGIVMSEWARRKYVEGALL